jgi:hypothetical protein
LSHFAIAIAIASLYLPPPPLPLLSQSPSPPPPPPAFASPVVGWLLCCFPLSAFVIACRHATVNALVAPPIIFHHCHCRHRRCCHCRRTATAATATTMVELTVIHCQRMRQQQHHHQCTNSSTNVKTFTSPDNMDLFNLSTVFLKCVMLVEGI